MAEIDRASKFKEVKALLLVIGLGVVAAGFLSIGFLYFYNPIGSYRAGNMLLDPAVITGMQYSEAAKRGGDNTPFIFAGIEYSYFNATQKRWDHASIPMDRYDRLYKLIANDRSMPDVTESAREAFRKGNLSGLVIRTRRDNGGKTPPEDFLKVDFSSDGNYYKIELRAVKGEKGTEDGYAYFYHEGIGTSAYAIFLGN